MLRNVRPGSKEGRFAAVKPKDAFRVFVLGGSIASLLQYSGEKGEFANVLADVLPGKKVEVINCGMAGYESFREALVEQEILDYSPDLIVFLTGHNEGLASAPFPVWVMHAQERLSRLGAFRALVHKLHPDADSEKGHTDARADARDATFAKNLTENIRHAREHGVAVAVVVPPRNYREPAEMNKTPYDAAFVPGWLGFLRGDYAAARAAWKSALSAPAGGREPGSAEKAFTWGFIARAEEKLGLLPEARASFEKAAQFDRAAICGGLCQGIIRRVTAAEGGFLVESDAMFREKTFPRMPGLETFNDRMHWKPRFNCLMSGSLVETIRAQPAFSALPWDAARLKSIEASCEKPGAPSSEADDLRILSYVLLGLSWPRMERLSTVSVFYLQAIRANRPKWFEDVPKMVKLTTNPQTAVYGIEMAPDRVILPRFYWHIGEARLLEKDYAGAAKELNRALELEPGLHWARLSLGVVEALRGEKARGLALLKDAAARAANEPRGADVVAASVAIAKTLGLGGVEELASADVGYLIDKAEKALNEGRKADALASLDKAREANPPRHELRRVGQFYLLLKEPARFLLTSDALAAAYPDDVDLWVSRAEAAFGTGDDVKGVHALDRAEKLRPGEPEKRIIAFWRGRLKAKAGEKDKIAPVRQ